MIKKYLIVLLGSLFYCYEFFLRVSPSAVTSQLMQNFAVHATGLSAMSAGFFYAYVPMQMYAGFLGDKFGARKTLTFCIGLCSFATILFVLSPNICFAIFARFLMGLAASFAYVGPLMLANAWLKERYYAASAGLIQFIGSLGAYLVTSKIGAYALAASWKNTYYFLAGLGFVLMILVFIFVKNHPKDKNIDSSESKISVLASVKELLQKRGVWFIALVGFAFWAPMSIFAELWGASFLSLHEQVNIAYANSQMMYLWFGVMIGGPFWGWVSCFKRMLVLKIAYLLTFLSALAIIYSSSLSIWETDVLLAIFGFSCAAQCISFGLMRDYQGSHLIGTAVGFNNMFVILGGAVLQPLSGILIDYFNCQTSFTYILCMQFTFIMIPVISLLGLYVVQFHIGKIGFSK